MPARLTDRLITVKATLEGLRLLRLVAAHRQIKQYEVIELVMREELGRVLHVELDRLQSSPLPELNGGTEAHHPSTALVNEETRSTLD